VADFKNVRSIPDKSTQEEIKQANRLREQNEGLIKWADAVQKSKDDTSDRLDLATILGKIKRNCCNKMGK
jgi:hypothetical protein